MHYPSSARLHNRAEFDAVFQAGSKGVDRYFVCYVVRREQQGSRLGTVVSRKVGGAVVRNRVKRYIREFFRRHRGSILEPVDVVVVARYTSADASYAACAESLERALKRGGVRFA